MPDPHYPTVDIDFIDSQMLKSGKLIPNGRLKVGNTTTYVLAGPQPVIKRTITVREDENQQVQYEQATGLAARFLFIGSLLHWFEENRDWKEGGYFHR
jgi:hypothetical protein